MICTSNQPYILPARYKWRSASLALLDNASISTLTSVFMLRTRLDLISHTRRSYSHPFVSLGLTTDPSLSSIMAEVLAVLGATAASTQLAVQVTKSFIYLRDIVIKMKAAPKDVQQYTVHVEQLIALTELFKVTPELHTTITPILETCRAQATKINDAMGKLTIDDTERWYKKTKKKLQVAMKEKDINQMFERLDREKTSLIVAIAQVDR